MSVQQVLLALGGGPRDPDFSSVVTLLHFDGSNGSTTFTDVIGKTYTAVGNAQLATAQFKFGTASGLFDGSGDYVGVSAANTDFDIIGIGTAECWIRPTSLPGYVVTIGCTANGFQAWEMAVQADGSIFARGGSGQNITSAAGLIVVDTWTHIALNFNAGAATLYIGGTSRGTGSWGNNVATSPFRIGANASGVSNFPGYIDDVRVTKGVQRYTGNFTPPTAPFPDS